MIGIGLSPAMVAPFARTQIQVAIGFLERLVTSPAGIFTAGQGYLQTPGNLFKYSNVSAGIGTDYSGLFGGVGSTGVLTANYGLAPDGTMTAARVQLTLNGGTAISDRSGVNGVAVPLDSVPRTMAVYLKALSGSPTVLTRLHGFIVYTTLNTSTWTLVTVSGSSGVDATSNLIEIRGAQTPTNSNTADVLMWGAGLMLGTYTASQLTAMGGVPSTTAAAVPAVYTDAHVYASGSSQVSYGQELVTNGDFSNGASGWSLASNWTVSGGSANFSPATGTNDSMNTAAAFVAGRTYLVSYTVTRTTGNFVLYLGTGGSGVIRSASGSYTEEIVAGTGATLVYLFALAGFTGSVDNISVREKITSSSVINSLLSGNYVLSDGSTGLGAVDGPAGLALDGLGSVGSELVTNGDFGSATGWVQEAGWTIGSGVATATAVTGTSIYQTGIVTAGLTYQVTLTVNSLTSGNVRVYLGNLSPQALITSAGTYTFIGVASGNSLLYIQGGTSFSGVIDNVTCKQVTGIHATQPTTANKPTIRRGALNLLTFSEQLDNAAWIKGAASVTANVVATSAPDGTFTADKLVEDGTTAGHLARQNATLVAIGVCTGSVYLKSAERTTAVIYVNNNISTADRGEATFDLAAGTVSGVTSAGGFSGTTASIQSVGNGWYRCSVTTTASVTGVQLRVHINNVSYTGDGASGIFAWGAQLESGATLSDYSPTTTSAASNPNAGRYYWSLDGADALVPGAVPFQMSDDFAVVAGTKTDKLTALAQAIFSVGGAGAGFIELDINPTSGYPRAVWKDDASVQDTATYLVGMQSVPHVSSLRKRANSKDLRVNGATRDTQVTAMGATSLTQARIGARYAVGIESTYHEGNISIVIAIKAPASWLTDDNMLAVERFAAATLPNGPSF